jgi:hypothetical protein
MMSKKADRKRKVKKVSKKEAAFNRIMSGVDFNLENTSFIPDDYLKIFLTYIAEETGAKTAGVPVHVYVGGDEERLNPDGKDLTDEGHINNGEVHLPVCLNDDTQKAAEKFIWNAVIAWSLLANQQSGGKDGHTAACNDCLEAITQKALASFPDIADHYRTFQNFAPVIRGANRTYNNILEPGDQPEDVVSLFHNDGDVAIGLCSDGIMTYFRGSMMPKGDGHKPTQEDFKRLFPLNISLVALVNPEKIPVFIDMAYEVCPDSPQFNKAKYDSLVESSETKPSIDVLASRGEAKPAA